ncbi:alkaline phosphatase family protein [Tumebacillus permanentifrigoris]|uniref:Type I phosphodiesterase/nucleotide pyrophosphatase n=1 Tax=Tumebacillus permanentifrigoris TaxID=378543 RepID=A0A316D8I2_9BACL|nr:alkaline phosphatase family protein [Tumebacillus permanentifrigoris]PWK06949.1 type I phosphodiesterase/nucleotide pyrophosphatase [Tumebacillus permanentifrigoris]
MKKASLFEIIMARCWNVVNEGKTFTPVFVLAIYLMWHIGDLSWSAFGLACAMVLPMFVLFYLFDFPLHLRHFLWLPLLAGTVIFGIAEPGLLVFALGMYVFFTVFFWGTLYYHLRIGTTWWNFLRIWKLFLKNTDSTSGNVFEHVPKFWLMLIMLSYCYQTGWNDLALANIGIFTLAMAVFALVLHRVLFNWKPVEYPTRTDNAIVGPALAKKVIVVVIDGCRKERLYDAQTPFLDKLIAGGTLYDQMETIYPARTVSCFSSMFTGTYPREHGMKSNMVWDLGVKVQSIFEVLKQQGKKGVMFGCAHLYDAFGEYCETFSAVANNDVVDHMIMKQAKAIYERENPDLFVVQMIAVDQTGHSRGVLYEEYLEKIAEADALIADFYGWLEARGDLEDAVFVVMADHGQGDGIGGHGHLDVGERFVPFFMNGQAIEAGQVITDHRSIVSLAPTIAYLMGVPFPDHARGPVLTEAIHSHEVTSG